ncbi:MAG: HlyD family efflux transporter periplasmic adaptor subunit [Vicinamibacterales bacterium]|nr:HlyD family efflux transporter periplasmic adaptor subunit [Vicinamibacterales bacterium]
MSSETAQTSAGASGRPRPLVVGIIAAALVAGGVMAWRMQSASAEPTGVVTLSGRLEGDDSAVAARTSGRVVRIAVREGDPVKAGDVIAVLDDDQVGAREEQARAALAQAEARARGAREQIAVLEQQLRQVQLQTEQARADADGRVRQAEADLAGAEAQLAREQAALQIAQFDKEAYAKLAQSGAVSERQGKQAASVADQQAAAVAAAVKRVEAARGGLGAARSMLTNPEIRMAQSAAIKGQIAQARSEISGSVAQTEQARARLAETEAARKDLTILAPFDGTVVTRSAEPGEIVASGTAIVTIVDLGKMHLRGFVPEGRIGEVKAGQPARVYLDSKPDEPVEAVVTRIDPEATFTPENTYFREDRVKQVVGVKVQLKGAVGFAKPGMPADGEILVGAAWPARSAR